jgi:hypothetical protein
MKNLSFNFETPSEKDKSVKELVKLFAKVNAKAIDVKVDKKPSTKAGTVYRNVALTFADSQRITLGFKETGDVFEARLNGKMLPLASQDEAQETVKELANAMAARRAAFQRAMLKVRLPNPSPARTSKAKMLEDKIERRDALKDAITHAGDELAALTGSHTQA